MQHTPTFSLQQYFPSPLHHTLLKNSKTHQETIQLHSFSLKSNLISHPSISSRLLSLYVDPKINNLYYARSIFDRIENPTLFLYNLIIKCYIFNQQSHEAITLFCHLLLYGFCLPDNFTLPCVIKGCARLGAITEGKQIHGLVFKLGFALDKFVLGSLVSMYAKCGEIDSGKKVFDTMDDKDLVSWNSLIDGYVKSGEIEVAMKLFDEMPERDLFSWTCLVDGLSKCGKLEIAREMFDRMPDRNSVSWNAMINGYMKSGDFDSARVLFDDMPIRNLITWNSMIAGFESNGRFMEALQLFGTMLNGDVMPNDATLVSALSAVSGLASLSKGRWIHSYLVKNGFSIDGVLGTLLIQMYSKCGSIESSLVVFRSIPRKKVGHLTAMIVGLGMHGMAEQALDLFHELCSSSRMKPHAITFIGVLNACSHAGLVDDGRRYFDMMINDYGIEPTVEHYGCLVDILCRAGCLEEAKSIIESMPMRPNTVIWMSLLSGARNHGNQDIGEYAAQRLIEVSPDTIGCYVVLSNMYAAAGQWDKVSQVREMMKKRGFRKDPGCSSIEHGGVFHEFIVGDKSHPLTDEIYSKLSEMRGKLKSAGHVPDTTQVLLCVEDEAKELELEIHSERLAIAFGLIKVKPGSPIRIVKNLRVCNDCHSVTKLVSSIYNREIIVRDNSRFHHFRNGSCSCKDFW